ncbi:MAG TPA: valine--tRNA ligase [Exilispira sp.]|nr:valine--tRNA ligase [Exilispira sp.]
MSDNKTFDIKYNPIEFEQDIYDFWEKNNVFKVEIDKNKQKYVIPMPPPNVTGVLHMGHALQDSIQDLYIRYKKMKGYNVFWIPGKDHAGIATQNVVEKMLKKEGITKEKLGREKFIEKVWEVVEKHKNHIEKQKRFLGDSCDWSKEKFTLDEDMSKAVIHAFVELYNKGFIFKGKYIVNWCPRCGTALSDEEVDQKEEDSNLWYIKYPLQDGTGEVIVATTRPETMLGDTAVAVNPEDERYKNIIGKNVILPLVNRIIPVIADNYVDPSFGTGAVKITPAHDPNDYEVAKRHNLPLIYVIDNKGYMTEDLPASFAKLERYECRKAVVKKLEEEGYLIKIEPYSHSVGHCSRCDTVIEPMLSDQWFVKLKDLASEAKRYVKERIIKIYPSRWEKIYFDWVDNLKDWCISRQLWWGHRIPVYYCDECSEIIISESKVTKCTKCGSEKIHQDEDVLDTWFSSWLWPFSTLGWPEKTDMLNYFYPTDLLVSGYDILFFWVIKMIIAGSTFLNQPPFYDIYLTPLIRDKFGRKMSKSLGNGIDPLDIVKQYGADALRFTLVYLSTDGQDINLDPLKFEMGRNFANKLWNAFRFAYPYIEEINKTFSDSEIEELFNQFDLYDKWILAKLNQIVKQLDYYYENYKIQFIAQYIYNFVWHDFCDWYIESCKPFLFGSDLNTRKTKAKILKYLINTILKIIHPLMPFISEKLFQSITSNKGYILANERYPKACEKLIDEKVIGDFTFIEELVTNIRTIKAELNLHSNKNLVFLVKSENENEKKLILQEKNSIKFLAQIEDLMFVEKEPEKKFSTAVVKNSSIFLVIEGLVDIEKEVERLKKEIGKINETKEKLENKLKSKDFIEKAKAEIIERTKKELSEYQSKIDKLIEKLKILEK